jgi:hypothetical protein
VQFNAPSSGIYEFSCGDSQLIVKGSFSVIAAEPAIGQGLTISSTMANSPPSLEKIENKLYDSTHPFDSFTISAVDPDDDTLTYSAFNIPMVASGYDENGHRMWQPTATLDKNSGLFSWNELSSSLSPGKYFIRIEVSDGILNDYQEIVIEIKEN